MVTSIPLKRCLCYKPELCFSLPPMQAKSKLLRSCFPLFSFYLIFRQQLVKKHCLTPAKYFYWEYFLNKDNGVINIRFGHLSDLIQHTTGNGHRHASGPVRSNLPPVTQILGPCTLLYVPNNSVLVLKRFIVNPHIFLFDLNLSYSLSFQLIVQVLSTLLLLGFDSQVLYEVSVRRAKYFSTLTTTPIE